MPACAVFCDHASFSGAVFTEAITVVVIEYAAAHRHIIVNTTALRLIVTHFQHLGGKSTSNFSIGFRIHMEVVFTRQTVSRHIVAVFHHVRQLTHGVVHSTTHQLRGDKRHLGGLQSQVVAKVGHHLVHQTGPLGLIASVAFALMKNNALDHTPLLRFLRKLHDPNITTTVAIIRRTCNVAKWCLTRISAGAIF